MTLTRRSAVRTTAFLTVGLLAGCLTSLRGPAEDQTTERPTQASGADRETPTTPETQAPTPIPQPDPAETTAPLRLTMFNEDDEPHTVTIAVERAETTVYENEYTLGPGGIAEHPLVELDPGTYDLTVVDSAADSYHFDWEVPADGTTDGLLSVVVREDGTFEPTFATRHVSGPDGSTCNGEPCRVAVSPSVRRDSRGVAG